MLFQESYPKVVNSLPVTLLSFIRASSPIDHSTATIYLPYSPTTSSSSSSHTASQFTPLFITVLAAFDSLTFWLTVSNLAQMIRSLSRCICLPLSMQTLSSYHSTLAYVFIVIRFAYLEGPVIEGLHHTLHFPVDWIVGLSDWNFLGGLWWCRSFFARDCWQVYHHWHHWDPNSRWDWIWRDSRCHTCSFWVQERECFSGTHVLRTCFPSLSYLNVEGSLGSSSCFISALPSTDLGEIWAAFPPASTQRRLPYRS